MYSSLREHLRALADRGELLRIDSRVSPVLEIAAIADRASKTRAPGRPSASALRNDPRHAHLGGPALLFTNVEGSDWPVAINVYGSYRRAEDALGCGETGPCPGGFDALAERIAALVKPEPPRSLAHAWQMARRLLPLLRIPPKRRRGMGECQEVVTTGEEIDLRRLPLIKCWPLDGDYEAVGYPRGVNDGIAGLGSGAAWERDHRGRYITLGGIHTIHADERDEAKPSSHNIGMYRVQLLGPRRMAMHWHMHHDGARHWRSWKERGEAMPVAIALGGQSVLPYAATAPLPPGLSELLLAGFLNGGGIPMVRARTVPLWVPADAEIVIEGYVSAEAGLVGYDPRTDGPIGTGGVFEGPFGDHTGFYSLPDRYPVLDVTAVTHRRDAVYPTTVVGPPPQEDYFLGKATERIFLPLLKTIVPDIADYDLPIFGAFHNCAALKVRKEYPYHARRLMHAVWGAGQMSWTKSIIVVDDDVDVHDSAAVLRAVGEHCVPARDCEMVRGPLDILDHAAPFLGAGGKIGLDATRKRAGAERHPALHSQSAIAEQACAAGEIGPVVGGAAAEAERRLAAVPGVLGARVPEELGGWWVFLKVDKRAAGDGAAVIKAVGGLANEVAPARWIVLVGPDADLADTDSVMFHFLANACPERDRTLSVCGRRVAFDATPKLAGDSRNGLPVRDWPPYLRPDAATAALIERRWGEYGFGGE